MIKHLCFFCVFLIVLVLIIKRKKVEYFYYEDIPINIKESILNTSFIENDNISLDNLVLVHILHIGFDDLIHSGRLIVNRLIAPDVISIFEELYLHEYKIEEVELIGKYEYDDELSMINNNTSAFNYRYIKGTNRLSLHSYGLAIDINPFYNPYVYQSGLELIVSPSSASKYVDRSLEFNYKIDKDDFCYKTFIKYGFEWGGNWNNIKDYQHFEKRLPNVIK